MLGCVTTNGLSIQDRLLALEQLAVIFLDEEDSAKLDEHREQISSLLSIIVKAAEADQFTFDDYRDDVAALVDSYLETRNPETLTKVRAGLLVLQLIGYDVSELYALIDGTTRVESRSPSFGYRNTYRNDLPYLNVEPIVADWFEDTYDV